jgi:ornithine cyclodeaminase/alanine dehydrogenase-like protein (mu-crystallin family)
MAVLVLSHDDVVEALTPEDCLAAVEAGLAARARGEAEMPLRLMMAPPAAAGLLGLMPAWGADATAADPKPVFALKAVCVIPDNPKRGLDAHQGTVTLFDGATGVPTAILDASAVTSIRTAAVTALATRELARRDARELAILGAGVQAAAHLDALLRVRDFAAVRVYAPTAAHVRDLIDGRPDVATELGAAESAEAAVRGADVVVAVTNAREPVLRREWLAPGAHVNAVGASAPAFRELDTATVADAELFVDSRESLRAEAGEFQLAVREGAIPGLEHVRAELGEVLVGARPGRSGPEALTVFRSLGIAVEDLAAATRAVGVARERGLGVEVPL